MKPKISMSAEQLKSFINEETFPMIRAKSGQQNCKKRIKHWLHSLWKYFSKNGPKIDKLDTSITELKFEEMNNWTYSKLILSYDIISVKRTIRLQEKAIQQQLEESMGIMANMENHKTNQNCTTMETNKPDFGYIKPKEDTSIIGNKESESIGGEINKKNTTFYNSSEPKGSFQSFVDTPVKAATTKTSEVDEFSFPLRSLSESPKRRLPPIPTDHYTTPIRRIIPLSSTRSIIYSEKALKQQQSESLVSTEGVVRKSKLNEGNIENCFLTDSIQTKNHNSKTLTAKERNMRFLNYSQSKGSRNTISNIQDDSLTPSEYEILCLSEDDSVRFYRLQNSRRNTTQKSLTLEEDNHVDKPS